MCWLGSDLKEQHLASFLAVDQKQGKGAGYGSGGYVYVTYTRMSGLYNTGDSHSCSRKLLEASGRRETSNVGRCHTCGLKEDSARRTPAKNAPSVCPKPAASVAIAVPHTVSKQAATKASEDPVAATAPKILLRATRPSRIMPPRSPRERATVGRNC